MAGRSYNLSAESSSQSAVPKKYSEGKSLKKNKYCDDFEDDDFDDDGNIILSPKFQLWILLVFVAAMLTGLCVYFVAICRYDYQNGAAASNELVTVTVKSLNDFDYSDIESYVPRGIRDAGFISDSDTFAQFRKQSKEDTYVLRDTVIVNDEPFDDLQSLQSGLSETYGKTVNISAARLMTVHLTFTNGVDETVKTELKIIAIKVYHKWYLYTGKAVSYQGEPVEFMTFLQSDTDTQVNKPVADISYVKKIDMAETESDEHKVELDFYEDAVLDLQAGKCMINDTEYTIPGELSSFSDVFVLNTDAMKSVKTTVLKPDETLGNVPVLFQDEALAKTPVYVTLGNLSSKDVKLQDASVTTLYVGAGETSLNIFLPGNVTFGTSYKDVVKMYGDLDTTEDTVFHGKLAEDVYSLSLSSNKQNKIYFGFKDGKLVEIQWYYIDMTNYREI